MTSEHPPPYQIDSWQAAEKNAVRWMRFWGHTDARTTKSGPDGGIDIRSATAVAQVKYEAHHVGTPALRQLVGAGALEPGKKLMFFTGSGYSGPAIAYADATSIALFKYELDGTMSPLNKVAETVSFRGPNPDGTVKPPSRSGQKTVEESPSVAELASGMVALLSLALLIWNIIRLSNGDPDSSLWHPASNAGWLISFSLATIASARSERQRLITRHVWTIPWIALLAAFPLEAALNNEAAVAVTLLVAYGSAAVVGLALSREAPSLLTDDVRGS